MSMIWKVLIGVVILIFCVVAVIFAGMFYLHTPTKGKSIEKYETPQKALLVIDIQEDYTGTEAWAKSPHKNSVQLIAAVNKVIEKATSENIKVVYIKQEFDGFAGTAFSKILFGGTVLKGNPGTEVDKRISITSNNIFSKPIGDAFSNLEFEKFLIQQQVNELYIVGLDAQWCVSETAKGALNRGYKVNIVTDGIALANKDKWDELMKKYEQEGINLINSDEI